MFTLKYFHRIKTSKIIHKYKIKQKNIICIYVYVYNMYIIKYIKKQSIIYFALS